MSGRPERILVSACGCTLSSKGSQQPGVVACLSRRSHTQRRESLLRLLVLRVELEGALVGGDRLVVLAALLTDLTERQRDRHRPRIELGVHLEQRRRLGGLA